MNYSASEKSDENFRSGMIALAGRPNVGKSTLLNCLLKQKVSITSKKANTTRHRIMGVLNDPGTQYVFIDLPGFNTNYKRLVDRSVYKTATTGVSGTDLVLLVIDCRGWHEQDTLALKRIRDENLPFIVVLSKIDRVKNKNLLLPVIQDVAKRTQINEIVPVSAVKDENIAELKKAILKYLLPGPPLFPSDVVTDKGEIFRTAESIREQIFRYYGDEIPYTSAVQIEKYEQDKKVLQIDATIWVESKGQKRIMIGSGGSKIKRIGTEVRTRIEAEQDIKVFLNLWVKVRTRWTDDLQSISNFGFSETD